MITCGRIYKIENDVDNLIYIGCTSSPLSARMAQHRCSANKGLTSKFYTHMRNIGVNHFKIILVHEVKGCSKEYLKACEDYAIKFFDTVKNGLNGHYEDNGICHHDRKRAFCSECPESQICNHNKQKAFCSECGGNALCDHNNQKHQCSICNKGKFHCQVCDRDYPGKKHLERHFKTKVHLLKLQQ